jgi:hypothetical protein
MVPHLVQTIRDPNRGIWHVPGPMIGLDDRFVVALVAADRERPDAEGLGTTCALVQPGTE